MTACTTTDCQNPTETYLCSQCVSDLQQWIDKVPDLIEELFTTMARMDQVRPAASEGGGGGGAIVGSPPPINLDAGQLRWNLQTIDRSAADYAQDQYAAGIMKQIIEWCQKADLLILGPPELRIIDTCDCGGKIISSKPKPAPDERNPDPEDWGTCEACHHRIGLRASEISDRIAKRVRDDEPDPMTSTEVREWIKDRAGIIISADDIKNWSKAKKIRQVPPGSPRGKPAYYAVDILRVHFAHVQTNRRMTRHTQ